MVFFFSSNIYFFINETIIHIIFQKWVAAKGWGTVEWGSWSAAGGFKSATFELKCYDFGWWTNADNWKMLSVDDSTNYVQYQQGRVTNNIESITRNVDKTG